MKNELSLLGGLFVLVMLVILSMISFSVLSFSSASADLRLAQTSASRIQEYYRLEAESNINPGQAEEWQDKFEYDAGGIDIWLNE